MTLTSSVPIIVISLFILLSWIVKIRSAESDQVPAKGERFDYLDGLRGVAAVAVVVTHFWRITPSPQGVSFTFDDRLNYGSLGVQVFFCITGFLFFGQMMSRGGSFSWDNFYRSRIRRVVPAYISFLVLGVIALLLYGDIGKVKLDQVPNVIDMAFMGFAGNGAKKVFAGVTLDYIFVVIWTLRYEVLFYFVFPFIVYFIGRVGVLTGFSLLSAIVAYEIARTGGTLYGYFVVGGIAYVLFRDVNLPRIFRVLGSLLALAIAVYSVKSDYAEYGFIRFLLSSSLFLLVVSCRPVILSSAPLKYLGDISYSIYLVHAPLLIINRVVFGEIFSAGSYGAAGFFVIALSGVLSIFIVSAMQYRYVELPFLRKPSHTKSGALELSINR